MGGFMLIRLDVQLRSEMGPKKIYYVNNLCYFRSFKFNLILDGEKTDLCYTVTECDRKSWKCAASPGNAFSFICTFSAAVFADRPLGRLVGCASWNRRRG